MTVTGEISADAVGAVADRFFSADQLAAARAVLGRVIEPEQTRLAFVSGSLAAGLGHALSDIDVYVAAVPGATPRLSEHHEAGHTVHINPISADGLADLARLTTAFQATSTDRAQITRTDKELIPAVRYAIGTLLVERDSGLVPPDQAWVTMRRVLIAGRIQSAVTFAEDAFGALQVGDVLTAMQAATIAFGLGVECLLAAVGDLYVGQKFLLRRIARHPVLAPHLELLWEGLRLPSAPGPGIEPVATARRAVRGRLSLLGQIAADAFLDGWDQPLEQFAPALPAAADGPARSPWALPIRFAEEWGLIAPDTGFETRAGMIRLWRALDGRPAARLVPALLERPEFAGTAPQLLETAVARLIEEGVAEPGGAEGSVC